MLHRPVPVAPGAHRRSPLHSHEPILSLTECEEVPSDAEQRVAAEEDDAVERQLQDPEEARPVRVAHQLLARAVAKDQGSQGPEPQEEGEHAPLKDLVESSHFLL